VRPSRPLAQARAAKEREEAARQRIDATATGLGW
jgi:hypothetical protein